MKTACLLSVVLICWSHIAIAFDPDGQIAPESRSAVVSPDGLKILFTSNAGADSDIWIANRDGSNPRPIVSWRGSDEEDPDWSPDGKFIVFSSNRNNGKPNIWRTDQNGQNPKQLTTNAESNSQPRYSPDGLRIVFTSNRTGKRELWLMSADGSNQSAVGLIPLRISDPTWSPNGQEILYVGCSGGARCNLHIIRVDAASSRQLTFGNFNDWQPDWSALGIVFSSDREGLQSIWHVNPDGTGLQVVTTPGPTGDMYPRWDRGNIDIVFTRAGLESDAAASSIWSGTVLNGVEKRLTQIQGFLSKGDVNTDGQTDCSDLSLVRSAFGKKAGQVGYDSRADIDADGVVSVRDLATVSQNLPLGTVCR